MAAAIESAMQQFDNTITYTSNNNDIQKIHIIRSTVTTAVIVYSFLGKLPIQHSKLRNKD